MVQFKVNDVQPELNRVKSWMPTKPNGVKQAIALAGEKEVDGFSHVDASFILGEPLGIKNPLLAAVYLAFSHHLPLTLSPDAIWNTLMLGVSTHVAKDPEKHRHAFVSHQGKKTLLVRDDTLRKGCGTNNWGKIAHQFTAQIAENLSGVAAIKALNTKFTTTDEVASIAHAIVFMDVVKSYFEYRVTTACGIPTVELTGTKEDWQKLRKGLALLDDLDLSPWRAQLDRILLHFEGAFDNKIEQPFWNDIFLKHGAFGSGGVTTISGWIANFFLYTSDGVLNPGALGEAGVRLDPVDIPCGLSETPFTWEYFSQEFKMLLRGGLVGVVVDPVTHCVAPQIGWLVTDAEDKPQSERDARQSDYVQW